MTTFGPLSQGIGHFLRQLSGRLPGRLSELPGSSIVSGVAALVMLGGALLLGGDLGDLAAEPVDDAQAHEELTVRAVLLDTAADAVTAAGVAVAGAVILVSGGLYWLDPAVALIISVVVAGHAARLLLRVHKALSNRSA